MAPTVDSIPVALIMSSPLGGIVAITVALILIVQISYHRCKTIRLKSKSTMDNISFYTLIIYLISIIITSSSYAFIRANFITKIDPLQFNITQCSTGYIVGYLGLIITKSIPYFIFLNRIKTVFHNSAYAYNNKVYNGLFAAFIIQVIIMLTLTYLDYNYYLGDEWTLFQYEDTKYVFCSHVGDTIITPIEFSLILVFEIANSMILLYMFTKGLYSLFKQQIKTIVHEYDIGVEMEYILMEDVNDEQQPEISMDVFRKSTSVSNADKQRVEKLYGVIKKQTILCFFALISSIVFWLSCMIVTLEQVCWLLVFDCICVWMTFYPANRYWIFCTKYGLCCICYRH